MSVMDDLFGKEPETRYAEFCLDADLRIELATVQLSIAMEQSPLAGREPDDRKLRALVEREAELREQAQGRMIRFRFAALDPEVFDRLKADHRPTESQLTKHRHANKGKDPREREPEPDVNIDTYPQALVAAACVKVTSPSGEEDGLSLDDVERMWKSAAYNKAEKSELYSEALAAQTGRVRLDLPKDG